MDQIDHYMFCRSTNKILWLYINNWENFYILEKGQWETEHSILWGKGHFIIWETKHSILLEGFIFSGIRTTYPLGSFYFGGTSTPHESWGLASNFEKISGALIGNYNQDKVRPSSLQKRIFLMFSFLLPIFYFRWIKESGTLFKNKISVFKNI